MYTRYPSKSGRLIAYNPLFSILQRFFDPYARLLCVFYIRSTLWLFDFFHPSSCSLFHISTASHFYTRSTLCGRGNKIKKETNSSSTSSFNGRYLVYAMNMKRWMIEVDSVLLLHIPCIYYV